MGILVRKASGNPTPSGAAHPHCNSCKATLTVGFALSCTGCLQYHNRQLYFCFACADRFHVVAAHQYLYGGDHLFRRTPVGQGKWVCNNCNDTLKHNLSFTCPACPYTATFDLCLRCISRGHEITITHKHSDSLVKVVDDVISLRSLVDLHSQFASATTRCSCCRSKIIGPRFRCRNRGGDPCSYNLCAECINSGKGRSHRRASGGDHIFQVEYGDSSQGSNAPRSRSSCLVPLITRQRLSCLPQAEIISELQARYSELRLCRNNAIVGIFASVGLSFFTHGTSLFGLLFSGPKFVYYTWKIEKLKKTMKKHNVGKPKRRLIELVAPLAVGALVGLFGLGMNSLPSAAGVANPLPGTSTEDASTQVVSSVNFLSGIGSGAVDAVKAFATTAVSPPSDVFGTAISHSAEAFNPTPLDTTDSEAIIAHVQHGGQTLHDLADSVQHGTVFTEYNGYEIGRNVTSAYLGELMSKELDKVTRLITESEGGNKIRNSHPSRRSVLVDIASLLQESSVSQRRDRQNVDPRSWSADLTIPPRSL